MRPVLGKLGGAVLQMDARDVGTMYRTAGLPCGSGSRPALDRRVKPYRTLSRTIEHREIRSLKVGRTEEQPIRDSVFAPTAD